MASETENESAVVKSADRALAVLEALAFMARPVTFSELQADLGYPRSSLHGLLATLEHRRWIERDVSGDGFTLGIRAWEVGSSFPRVHQLDRLALPRMEVVRDALGETVQLAELDGMEVVYLAKVDGPQALRLDSAVGSRLEAHATGVGKALLAALPPDELRERVERAELRSFTDTTITDPEELFRELDEVRSRGFAKDNEERTAGAACVAVPIIDREGRTRAAISVSAPVVRFGSSAQREALKRLRAAAEEIGSLLV